MKKRILMILTVLISIVFLSERVNAASNPGWATTMERGTNWAFRDCTGASTCTTGISPTIVKSGTSNPYYEYVVANTTSTIASNGIAIGTFYPLEAGILYNVQIGFCSNKSLTNIINNNSFYIYGSSLGTNDNYGINNNETVLSKTMIVASNEPWGNGVDAGTNCYLASTYLSTNVDTKIIVVRLKSSTAISGFVPAGIAYKVEAIGQDTKTLQNIITNAITNSTSNLSTKSDIDTLNNNIKNEINTMENNIINEDNNYNQNESQSTQEQKEQIENYEQEEDNLRNSLNLNIEDAEITIKPEANTFIWEVVNKLRTMNGKIVLLFTSILSLGIMKMILGR